MQEDRGRQAHYGDLDPEEYKAALRAKVAELAASCVKKSSSSNYETHMNKWRKFLGLVGLPTDSADDVVLEGQNNHINKREVVDLFITHLHTKCENAASTIANTLTGVRHNFMLAGVDVEMFEHPRTMMIRKGIRNVDASQGRNKRDEEKRIPFKMTMLLVMLDNLTTPTCSRYTTALGVGLILGYFGCLRVSNYVPRPLCPEHCITADDVEFCFKQRDGEGAETGELDSYLASWVQEWDGYLMLADLVYVQITVRSSKTDRDRKGHAFYLPSENLPTGTFNAAEHLWLWARAAGYQRGTDPFVSYLKKAPRQYGEKPEIVTRVIPYEEHLIMIKQMATEFGIPWDQIGTHNWRIGAATAMKTAERDGSLGVAARDSQVNELGAWAENSTSVTLYERTASRTMQLVYAALARVSPRDTHEIEMACNTRVSSSSRAADGGKRSHMSPIYLKLLRCEPLARLDRIRAGVEGARASLPKQLKVPLYEDGGRSLFSSGRSHSPPAPRRCSTSIQVRSVKTAPTMPPVTKPKSKGK